MFKKTALIFIKVYQKTISFDHGLLGKIIPIKACGFVPTCSQYTLTAIQRFGLIKGGTLGFKRILRCHPFNPGGSDPVPKRYPNNIKSK
ncbi:MAG: membrane protein insertion efficiency factor YidD [Candidatus Moranbacteria bacterium]|nr:membrane protein insertion efficiency factor YidD [Candidatus Moranbacteria bacterium]